MGTIACAVALGLVLITSAMASRQSEAVSQANIQHQGTDIASPANNTIEKSGEEDWPLFRGNAQSTGVATSKLPAQLTELWNSKLDGTGINAASIVVRTKAGKQLAITADMNGRLHAMDLKTGDEVWKFEAELGFNASPAWKDDRVYIGDLDGFFYCIDADGKEIWKHRAGSQIDSGAGFFEDCVLFTSQDSFLYCLAAADGAERWTIETGDQLRCAPTVIDGQVMLAGCDGMLHIVDLKTGKETGSIEINSPTGATPAANNGMAFFGTHQVGMLAVNLKDKKIAWQFDDDGNVVSIGGNPAVTADRVIFGASNRTVYCLKPDSGKILWKTTLSSSIETSPVISGDTIYVAANDGRLFGLELETGNKTWEYEVGGGFAASPAVAFGRLLIGNKRGAIICLGEKPDSDQK